MKLANLAGAMALLLMQGCAPPTEIGFLSPDGLSSEFSPHVDVAMVNALSIEQLTISLHEARRANIRLLVDLGPNMRQPAPASEVKGSYLASDGKTRQKQLTPAPRNKLWARAGHADGMRRLQPFLPLLSTYADVLDSVFLIDEPYLNGVSRQAYGALAGDMRQALDGAGLQHVKIGVIFSSALFNADFAQLIQQRAAAYAEAIDNEYLRIGEQPATAAERAWRDNIAQYRLTTYDLAGNIYTGGGIPDSVDWVSFDFYISSLLLDDIHEQSLAWLAERFVDGPCTRFAGQSASDLRKQLSFFHDEPMRVGEHWIEQDRALLDAAYDCRREGSLALLREAIAASRRPVQIMLIGESSDNGLLEFDARSIPKQGQPAKLVELRVRDEVLRARNLLQRHEDIRRLLYFTYANAYDPAIALHIGGAADMPSVLEEIYRD